MPINANHKVLLFATHEILIKKGGKVVSSIMKISSLFDCMFACQLWE